jgi:mono/diheme cytochrome c family protein
MVRSLVGSLGLALLLAAAPAAVAVAQQADGALRFEQGQELYQDHCVLCHEDSGAGNPPAFPALSGNARLGDLGLIVRAIHKGRGNMPPFHRLSAEDISSLAHYVRNAWANDFGGVSTEAVAAVLEGLDEIGPVASVWDGVFTEAQATRGRAAYPGSCGTCHGRRLNGAPDDPDMLSTPPLATLFEYTRATMPESNPGSLTDEEYVDIIAYMLSVSGMPPGADGLHPDPQSLAQIVIEQQP